MQCKMAEIVGSVFHFHGWFHYTISKCFAFWHDLSMYVFWQTAIILLQLPLENMALPFGSRFAFQLSGSYRVDVLCSLFNTLLLIRIMQFNFSFSMIGCGLVQAQYALHNISRNSHITVHYFVKVLRYLVMLSVESWALLV